MTGAWHLERRRPGTIPVLDPGDPIDNVAATGSPWFWPANGAYNLFAGNNPFSAASLFRHFNAEQSLRPALDYYGQAKGIDQHDVPSALYVELTARFIRENIGSFLYLLALKTCFFFAPKVVYSDNVLEYFLQVILALPVFVWLSLAIWDGVKNKGSLMPRIMFPALYVLPFALTNSDPRFRMPLDVWFILDSFLLAQRVKLEGALFALAARFGPQRGVGI